MFTRALNKAKRDGKKKIPINFQVHQEIKSDFEKLCKDHNVSLTSMLTGLMETSLEESQGIYHDLDAQGMLSMHYRINELTKEVNSYYQTDTGTGERVLNEGLYDIPIAMHQYNETVYELSRLKTIFQKFENQHSTNNKE
jgi:hypothetical protein